MSANFCSICKDYEVLSTKENEQDICYKCSEDLTRLNGFANYLERLAIYHRDDANQMMLNAIKVQARLSRENGFITSVELMRIEKVFITLQPI
jgi:hypothetical protein